MRYEEAKRNAQCFIDFITDHFYDNRNETFEEFQKRFPGTELNIYAADSMVKAEHGIACEVQPEGEPSVSFRLVVNRKESALLEPPRLVFFAADVDDEMEPVEECNSEIQQAIEDKIKKLKHRFSDEDISYAMLDVIRDLLAAWTLPDDRKDLLDSSLECNSSLSIDDDICSLAMDFQRQFASSVAIPRNMFPQEYQNYTTSKPYYDPRIMFKKQETA